MEKSTLPPFDKYYYYSESVQSPDEDARFLEEVYLEQRGKKNPPKVMREDFCGTFANSCAWVKRGSDKIAYGIDLEPETIEYGATTYLPKLEPEQQKRVHTQIKNVLGQELPHADVICALNFSYFIFKDRKTLKHYFENCLSTLNDDGLLVLDCFGGTKCYEPNEEETEYEDAGFSYFWDQDTYDPVTNEAMFYIHFKRQGEKKRMKLFSYDWRMWSLPELRDLALEAGFKDVKVYWEGTTEDGEGDGEFHAVDKGEDCDSWVAYVVAMK